MKKVRTPLTVGKTEVLRKVRAEFSTLKPKNTWTLPYNNGCAYARLSFGRYEKKI